MSTYEISKSSLLSLKAEILKKQEEVQKSKLENVSRLNQQKVQRKLELKNKSSEKNTSTSERLEEDEDLLRKSRDTLEAKSKLYDRLSKGTEDEVEREYNRRYLVHFDRKAHESNRRLPAGSSGDEADNDYAAENSDEEWVEFVDCFGRTRTCLRTDLHSFKAKDKQIRPDVRQSSVLRDVPQEPEPEVETSSFDEQAELLSTDMRRELLRRQWEKEEEELKDKSKVHYQDVLFNEARTHGVGYYGFAKDEATRAAQQDALKQLRKETQEQQQKAQDARMGRAKQMQARIRAAKNRKRAREGLPPITSDDEAEEERRIAEATAAAAAEHDDVRGKATAAQEEEAKQLELKRKKHVRPWDVGKEGVLEKAQMRSGAKDPYSQDEWNTIQRNKRDGEFAPPQRYSPLREFQRAHVVNPYKGKLPAPIRNEVDSADSDDELLKDYRQGAAVPPPPTFDYYGPSDVKRPRDQQAGSNASMEDSIMQGLRYLREKVELNKN